jgi:hypothetical protein
MIDRHRADIFTNAAQAVLSDMQVATATGDFDRFMRDAHRLGRLVAALYTADAEGEPSKRRLTVVS